MPAIFDATWPRLYIPESRNCKKQNVKDLQHQICLHQVRFCRLDFYRVVCEIFVWFIATKNNPANHNHGVNKQHFTVKNARKYFQNLSFRASLALRHCASEKKAHNLRNVVTVLNRVNNLIAINQDKVLATDTTMFALITPISVGVRCGGRGGRSLPGLENVQGKLCFQGKRKLLKIPEW